MYVNFPFSTVKRLHLNIGVLAVASGGKVNCPFDADQLKRHHTSMPLPGQLLSHHCGRPLCLWVKHGFNEIKHHLRHEAVTALPSPMRPLGHSDWRTWHEKGS